MPKLIKVHNDTYDNLASIRKDEETFNEVVCRLLTLYDILQRVLKENQVVK